MLMRSAAVAAVLLAATPAFAQKQSVPLLPTLGEAKEIQGTLSGSVRIRVLGARDLTRRVSLRAPFGKDGIMGAIKIGDATVATFDNAPYQYTLDTTRYPDGGHVLRLVLLDTKRDRETLLEQTDIFLRNGQPASQPLAATAPSTRRVTRATALTTRSGPPLDSIRRLRPGTFVAPNVPEKATVTQLTPRLSTLKSLQEVRASVLCTKADGIMMGLPDGGIAFCTEREAEDGGGTVVRLPKDAAATRAVTAVGNRLYWVTGQQDLVYCFNVATKKLTVFDATATTGAASGGTTAWIRHVSAWQGKLALSGAGTSQGVYRILDEDGDLTDLCDNLPDDVAMVARGGEAVACDFAGSGARLAVVVRERTGGATLHLYATPQGKKQNQWTERVLSPVTRSLSNRPVAVSAWGVATLDTSYGGAAQGWTFSDRSDSPTMLPEMRIGGGNSDLGGYLRAGQVTIGGSGMWIGADGAVFHVDVTTGKRAVYMPWNGAGSTITDLCADADGVWVATSAGVRRITPAKSNPTNGFGGYVRARLDDTDAVPKTEQDQAAFAVVEDWQGAPYKWGGTTKKGTDCSGYVGAIHRAGGVNLPRTSSEMGTTPLGKRVRDELQWGDTLVFPGHVAFYLGNGQTAETTSNHVGKATIWRRREVIVRRFLH